MLPQEFLLRAVVGAAPVIPWRFVVWFVPAGCEDCCGVWCPWL